MSINNIIGPPVEGEDFFGREKELEFAWKRIQSGNSLLLSAPRRVGKTSFAKKLLEKADSEGWNTLEINLEEVQSEEGFVRLLIEKLEEKSWWLSKKKSFGNKIDDLLSRIKPSVEIQEVTTSFEYQKKKENIYEDLKKLLDHNEELLIALDEVTILLNHLVESDPENGKRNAEFFLNWLRSFRQRSGTKIRWIFCSSVSINNFASFHNVSYTINDVPPFPLAELTPKKAFELFRLLSESEGLIMSESLIRYSLKKIGWHLPYFIQILFSNINQSVAICGKALNKKTVDESYEALTKEKHLNTWDERLKEYRTMQHHAQTLLNHLSKIHEGESRSILLGVIYGKENDSEKAESILSQLINMLQNDGYLMVTAQDKYTFRSPLLRDFWFNRYIK